MFNSIWNPKTKTLTLRIFFLAPTAEMFNCVFVGLCCKLPKLSTYTTGHPPTRMPVCTPVRSNTYIHATISTHQQNPCSYVMQTNNPQTCNDDVDTHALICLYISTHASIYSTFAHVYMHSPTSLCIHPCLYAFTQFYMHPPTSLCIHSCLYASPQTLPPWHLA